MKLLDEEEKEALLAIAVATLIILVLLSPIVILAVLRQREIEYQSFIVRYGTVHWVDEDMQLLTEDGAWTLECDPPEYEEGTKVRILFDPRWTKDPSDDIVVDITEMEEMED